MPIREDLVSSALTFLSDPKVHASPLAKRLAFLESKGLTQEEITEVLNRLNNPAPTSPSSSSAPPVPQYASYGNPYGQPPEPPGRDWRDWFIMAVVSSGVTYGLYTLAKRYVVPLIKPPTPPQLEADKAEVAARFDEAQQILEELKSETTQLREAQEKQKQQIDEALEAVEKAVEEVKESGRRRESDLRSFKADIDAIRELIPRALERNKENQTNQLQDLQNELKSLKALLLNRMGQRPYTPTGLPSSTSTPSMNTTAANSTATTEPINAAAQTGTETPPSASTPSVASPYLTGRQGIPAWQLAAREKAQQTAKEEEETAQAA